MVVLFIDIGGIDDRHYLNFHFLITFEHGNHKPKLDRREDGRIYGQVGTLNVQFPICVE